MATQKHAFLILARAVDQSLCNLITALDDVNNAIFIHVDRKSGTYQQPTAQHAQLIFTRRITVGWGAFSLIEAELILLAAATQQDHYHYYHLLSEADLPLKSNTVLHDFFAMQRQEFVSLATVNDPAVLDRIRYYYPFQERVGKQRNIFWILQKITLLIQKGLRIDRLRQTDIQAVAKGAQWFSITDAFARYVLSQTEWLRQTFSNGQAVDEVFMQTLLLNSHFKCNISDKKSGDLRLTIWQGASSPATLTMVERPQLQSSTKLFARKFDQQVDQQVIAAVLKQINGG